MTNCFIVPSLKQKFLRFFHQKFVLRGNQFILTEIVNFDNREIHQFYENGYYFANKCEKIDSNYDV